MLDELLDPPSVGSPAHVIGVGTAHQEEVASLRAFEVVLGVHVGAADGTVGIVLVELDLVVGAQVLASGEPAQAGSREPEEDLACEVARRHAGLAMLDSGQPVNAETMKPLWKNYATEISNEYAS
nr:hypothetical protein [Streptomyces sp. 846.5]